MAEYRGVDYLRKKLEAKRTRVLLRYKYYEMKNKNVDTSAVIPPEIRQMYKATLGWCGKAVDSLADRLVFRTFSNDVFDLNGIYAMNNPDVLFDSAVLSATISSCCFIYISPDGEGFPRLQVIDGSNATGIIDPITGLLIEGYAVLKRGENGEVLMDAYFTAGNTRYFEKRKKKYALKSYKDMKNVAPYPLLVPVINRPDANRPFGRSRISRACIYLQNFAKRTLERSEVSAEFYSFPQKYVLGLDPEAEEIDKWKATISSMLRFDKDEDGGSPELGQFSQQSMGPFTEQLKAAASMFAGETGLTMDDLGFSTDNPSSSEAIKASHESLRLLARKAQRAFGSGFLNAGYLAACVRDGVAYKRNQLYLAVPRWRPIFEADFAALSGAGDSLIKIQQAFPDYLTDEKLEDLLGL